MPILPSIEMPGVVDTLRPVIMKTSLGGYIMILPEKGVSAHSDIEDVTRCLSSEIHVAFGIDTEDEEELPRVMQEPEPRASIHAPKSLQTLMGIIFMVAAFFAGRST